MKYYLWVLGCAMNNADAERIASVLDLLGYQKSDQEDSADLIVTVACSVRQKAIDRIYGRKKVWQKMKAANPKLKLVLTGCVLPKDQPKMAAIFDYIFKIEDLGEMATWLAGDRKLNELRLGKSGDYLNITPHYESQFRAYVPIMTGCNNFCTYCAVPYTRGREKSRPKAKIVKEIETLVKKGYKEITLLGQNVNSYGNDLKKDTASFPNLLVELDKISGDWRGYFYSNHPKDMKAELIELLPTLTHFPPYIHLPLQSGSDRIIKRMNRHYTQKEYLTLVKKIKKTMPEVTLTTDIIVGFPGETETDFAATVAVMKKAKFDLAFTAMYSPRPGAKSADYKDDVSVAEKKRREKILMGILAETAEKNNQRLVGRKEKVLIDGQKSGKFYGRTAGYKVVEIKTDQALEVGRFYDVSVKSAGPWKIIGTVF